MSDFSLQTIKADVTATLRDMGVKSPKLDGKFHRFGKKLEKSYVGRQVLGDNGVYTFCRVFDFTTGEAYQIQHSDDTNPARVSKHIKKFNQDVTHLLNREEEERYNDVKQETHKLWQQASKEGTSAYLVDKGVESIAAKDNGLRYEEDVVYISMVDHTNTLWSAQRIFNDGTKRYKGRKKGLIHIIDGDDVGTVYVCEGYSTGASVAMATNATVVVVFDAGNIEAGIFTAQKHFPESRFVIAADNDQWKKSENSPDVNTGLSVATKVGQKFGYPVVYPVFLEEQADQHPTDFNDLHRLGGLDVVRHQLEVDGEELSETYHYSVVHSEDDQLTTKGLAIKVMERYQLISDYSGIVYQYNGRYWQPLPDNLLRKIIGTEDNIALDKPTRRDQVKKEIVDYALLDNVDASLHPSGIPWRQLPDEGDCIVFRNGVYNLNDGKLYPNKPEHYVDAVIPHRFNANAQCPTWMRCLGEWFGDDADDRIIALQQFFGYVMMPHARYKKALICFGPPNTGKSEIGKILTRLVGDMGLCSLGFEQMDKSEALVQIKGKYLNLISEPDKQSLINDGNFKKLVSTGEAVTIRHLYHAAEIYTPFAKHVILCNTLPRWNDETDATQKRLLLVEFDRVFADHEQDPTLEGKLAAEMEGIVNWALAGAMQVRLMNGRFSQPSSSVETLERHAIEQNPAVSYLYDYATPESGGSVHLKTLYETYKSENHYTKIGYQHFVRLLRQGGIEFKGSGNKTMVAGFLKYHG